jgi:hypothetical protein
MCWETGVAKRRFDDHLVSGSTRLSRALLGRIQRYDLHELLEYEPKLLAGQQAQAYDLPLDEAWQQARHTMRERTRQQCYEQATSTHILNFSMNLTFDEESWRYILLPVYIAIYHYRGQIFEVMVNGQTGAIFGPRPVGWLMIWLTIIGYMVPATLVTLLGILLRNSINNIGFVFVFAFILALIAISAAYNVIRQAQAMEDI